MKNIESRIEQLESAILPSGDIHKMTDAQLCAVLGMPEDVTDAELERIARGKDDEH